MPRTHSISNSDDIIDSRDVIARLRELRSLIENEHKADLNEAPDGLDEYDAAELAALLALQEEAEGYAPDWQYGTILIRDSHFEDYARELADEIGAIDLRASWPLDCIDWQRAADALKQDYTAVDFDGATYWVR